MKSLRISLPLFATIISLVVYSCQQPANLPTSDNDYGPDIFCDYLVDFMKRHAESGKPLLMYYPMALVHWEDARAAQNMGFPPTPDPDHPGVLAARDRFMDILSRYEVPKAFPVPGRNTGNTN